MSIFTEGRTKAAGAKGSVTIRAALTFALLIAAGFAGAIGADAWTAIKTLAALLR